MAKRKLAKENLPPVPKIENKYTQVVKVLGDLNRAKTADGKEVFRVDSIYFPEYAPYPVKVCPYSLHFIFDDPTTEVGHWTPMCSCGSPAGIVGADTYTQLMSPTVTGDMIVCLTHMKTYQETGIGIHADGSTE